MQYREVVSATMFQYPKTVSLSLVQTGPRTYAWYSGSFRIADTPSFRNPKAAVAWAEVNFNQFAQGRTS